MMLKAMDNKDKPKVPNWLIENIAEASKNARKIYFVYIGFLVYCAASIIGTSDRQIILNEAVRLPIIRMEVPLNAFFLSAPLIAIFLFVYFQLYLHKIKGLIGDLRANYAPAEKRRLYPWILNIADDPEPGVIGKVQTAIAKFSIWWLLPIVLFFFAFGFVKKHDPIMSYIIGATPILGAFVVLWFWRHYESLDVRAIIPTRGKLVVGSLLMIVVLSLCFVIFSEISNEFPNGVQIVILLIVFVSYEYLSFFTVRNKRWVGGVVSHLLALNVLLLFVVIPRANRGEGIRVDLGFQKLVTEQNEEYQGIYWADLRGVHLEGADLTSAVLKRADLEGANLWRAGLIEANLAGARLSHAVLYLASLSRADLQQANLFRADLRYVFLDGANLQDAVLLYANLEEAILIEANFKGANLGGANLRAANLERADLEGANLLGVEDLTLLQLLSVKTLYECDFDPVMMEQIQRDYPHLLEKPAANDSSE
jgi:hypothetical protein